MDDDWDNETPTSNSNTASVSNVIIVVYCVIYVKLCLQGFGGVADGGRSFSRGRGFVAKHKKSEDDWGNSNQFGGGKREMIFFCFVLVFYIYFIFINLKRELMY